MDVDFDAGMVEPYETDALATFQSAQSVATTDPKLLRRRKLDASQADKWRGVELPQPIAEATGALARAYGYEV